MDALMVTCLFLCLLFFAIFLKETYRYSVEKEKLLTHIHETTGRRGYEIRKRETSAEKWMKKLLQYSDDYAALGQRINFFSESHEVEEWLLKAGRPLDLSVERFQGTKILLALIGVIAGTVFFVLGFPLAPYGLIVWPMVGYFLPIILLKRKARERQERLRYDLPEFLDTVSVTLQAGVSLDQSLRSVIQFFPGPLQEEFSRFNQELDLGVPREKAYEQLLRRNDNPEFQMLIKALIQGMRLGVPIAVTFKIQSENMRRIRKELIKEKAAKASPKVTLITTFVVAPTAIALIGGLMVLNILENTSMFSDMLSK
ncbi:MULTISPECIES: type II secretion system F family protein [Brevibacillus]|jgi:tight adherence protein C|uniref:Type II secretion system F family protein n=1 Tax=Brevibacillus thermoruber TaxID=33942 RepID=A0A9X3TUD9_9BACL|nr:MULTISPECIES: type II secretion system F family protein [Brevibacillus]MDA5110410.1 type II secretion system F family protein [Brevibacillus thermoruber]UYZ13202.1 type II secretion system F family protein [Brevibacillus sp. WF146]